MTESNPEATFPFFFWNCLSRAGASQFHGHVQVMLTPVNPFSNEKSQMDAFRSHFRAIPLQKQRERRTPEPTQIEAIWTIYFSLMNASVCYPPFKRTKKSNAFSRKRKKEK